jgi:hypothetical protein
MFPSQENAIGEEYLRYYICRKMGWDYFTYISQPSFFIAEIIDCMQAEDIVKKLRSKQNE